MCRLVQRKNGGHGGLSLVHLDNASLHRTDRIISNIVVHMLPPNCTVQFQPQDAGLTRAFEARIDATKNWVLRRANQLAYRVSRYY